MMRYHSLTPATTTETPAMTTPPDLDPTIESLQEELRAQLAALNDLHHPVYPADPRRIEEATERVAGIRADLAFRKQELRSRAKTIDMPAIPAAATPAAPGAPLPSPAAVTTHAAKVGT